MPVWPYLPTLERIALALAIGLFAGLEREHRGKEAGLRTFAFVALIGCAGSLLGEYYALLSIAMTGILIVILNLQTIRTSEGTELTTSAALILTALAGALAGEGQTLAPTILAVVTAALLAWKKPLHEFSLGLTDSELRSAILLAILAFVVYPVLPVGFVDRWELLDLQAAWLIVILIAGIGFVNYILLKRYGAKGLAFAGFLGGLVNSTVTVTEMATRDRDSGGRLTSSAYAGIVLAVVASVLRNAILLALLAPLAFISGSLAFALMLGGGAALLIARNRSPGAVNAPPSGELGLAL
ncbi:MAG: MgtC/SapB family protein, partial [Gemmatimonadales bacterium]